MAAAEEKGWQEMIRGPAAVTHDTRGKKKRNEKGS